LANCGQLQQLRYTIHHRIAEENTMPAPVDTATFLFELYEALALFAEMLKVGHTVCGAALETAWIESEGMSHVAANDVVTTASCSQVEGNERPEVKLIECQIEKVTYQEALRHAARILESKGIESTPLLRLLGNAPLTLEMVQAAQALLDRVLKFHVMM
jgi:hypothetical protein